MNYTLAMHLHIQPNDMMSAKELMYYYSSYSKDLQEIKEREAVKNSMKKGNRKSLKIPMSRR